MTEDQRLRELAGRAAAMSAEAREAFLEELQRSDPDLHRRLAEFLSGAGSPTGSAATGSILGAGTIGPDPRYGPGDRVGRYVLRSVLGEGGFGVVYRADQLEPVRRAVALKVIKPGMDSAAVISRFEAERQALALMDHPCVAGVLDGGVTPRGHPFFVMELIEGVPITRHCDRHTLSLRERLELFIRVCGAVQHAHGKGVIHRDLKPSNILVEYRDGVSTPKIIDFGVAKAINQPLTQATIFTEQGQLIGTPEYMSPEQAEMTAQGLDTRSDVYSLGVILYELLSGVRPIEVETLREAGLIEIRRIIREVTPPRPSYRLSSLLSSGGGERAARLAAARRTEVGSLTGMLKRDLDWVVMKCLEKDRERRYDTASALGAELRRFLDGQPVEAGPPTAAYRVRKFIARHRAGVIAGSVFVALLFAGLAGTTAGLVRAEHERARTERVLGFIESDLLRPPVARGAGRRATLVEVLLDAAEEAEARFSDDALLRGRTLGAIGGSLVFVGEEKAAIGILRGVLAEGDAILGLHWQRRAALDAAMAQWRENNPEEALDVLTRLDPADFAGTALEAEYFVGLGGALKWSGRYDEAQRAYERAVERWTALKGAGSRETLGARYDLALVDLERGKNATDGERRARYRSALRSMRQVYDDQAASLGDGSLEATMTLLELSALHSKLGDFDDAGRGYSRAVGSLERLLGPLHWRTLQGIASTATLHYRIGNGARDDDPRAAAEAFTRSTEYGRRALARYEQSNQIGTLDAARTARVVALATRQLLRLDADVHGDAAAANARLIDAVFDASDNAAGVTRERRAELAAHLAVIYASIGRDDDEQAWRERVDALSGDADANEQE